MIRALIIITLLFSLNLPAATYYVRTDGNDSNTGTANTAGGAWLTWGKAASTAVDGDIVRSGNGGTFNEVITETTSGVTYVGNWSGPYAVVRGLKTSGASRVKFIGFAETHTDTSFGSNPNSCSGTYSNVWFVDCIFTNVYVGSSGYTIYFAGDPSYCVVRGCTISGANTTVSGDHANYGIASDGTTPDHMLYEYNFIEKVNDYVASFGTNNIYRNMHFGRHADSDWSTGTGHSDGFQLGSDGTDLGSKNSVIERIFMGTNGCMGMAENAKNGHFVLLNDVVSAGGSYGDTNFLIRGNVVFEMNNGSAPAVIGTDHVSSYDNTLYDFTLDSFGQMQVWRSTARPSLNSLIANMAFVIVTGSTEANKAFVVESGCTATVMRNWGYAVGTHASFVGTADPLFVNPTNGTRNFHLQSGSGLRGAGTNVIYITSATGSGTSFVVNDSQLLCDGFGIAEGDVVQIGATTTRITANDWSTHTITVAASVSWTQNDPVYWGARGSQKDIGALPYGSTDLTEAAISANGTTYTVTTTGDARGVWFYTNGIPSHWDYDAPYQATLSDVTVTAKAYALYAQQTPVVNAVTVGPRVLNVTTLNAVNVNVE